MADNTSKSTFYVAPFAVDGEFLGIGEWHLADLSPRWIEICQNLLSNRGSVFKTSLPAPFELVSLRFTTANGAALVMLTDGDVSIASSVLLRGEDSASESELLTSFVHSLRGTNIVRACTNAPDAFAEVFSFAQRPLHVVVVLRGSDDNGEAIAQFTTHLAGAFLCGGSTNQPT